jgi:hypothetical protein
MAAALPYARRRDPFRAQPFDSAEAAWFWTVSALAAREEGASAAGGRLVARPCDPDDVIRSLDSLYRAGGIGPAHAHALRRWGRRGLTPDPARPGDSGDVKLWREAMERLDPRLRARGIVA